MTSHPSVRVAGVVARGMSSSSSIKTSLSVAMGVGDTLGGGRGGVGGGGVVTGDGVLDLVDESRHVD